MFRVGAALESRVLGLGVVVCGLVETFRVLLLRFSFAYPLDFFINEFKQKAVRATADFLESNPNLLVRIPLYELY